MTRRRQLMNHDSTINGRGGRRVPTGPALGVLAAVTATLTLAGANQVAQEKPTTETNDCANTDCHPGLLNRPVMHRPTAQGQCLDCHEYEEPAEHLFNLVVPAEELCWECHDVGEQEFVHAPADDGNCTACHDPHGSDQATLLVKDPTRGLCLGCHDLGLHEKRFVHGPVAAQGCLACHDAHESDHEKLLTTTPTELCLSCHTEMSMTGPGARHRIFGTRCAASPRNSASRATMSSGRRSATRRSFTAPSSRQAAAQPATARTSLPRLTC
jgi:predicted CXXCH cytochrome family protein